MSGSGGSGGYEYQARATAYVAVHILTQQKLNWIDTADDIPVSVAVETGGSGDDLAITLQNGIIIELQAKHGLQKNKLWEPIVKLAQGLQENSSLYGILLTDSTASKVIREELRKDLQRLGQGRTDRLKTITQELQQKLSESNISSEPDLFRRLSIRVLDLDDGLQNSESACKMLPQVLENQNQASTAWKIFWGEGLNLTTNRGRRDATAWARLLSNESIQLASDKRNPAVISEIYRTWLQETTSHLIVPGIREKFLMQSDWLSLRAKQHSDGHEPFKAKFIPELYRLSIVAGEPGSGKSTFTKYLAHYLASSGKTVLRVRLPSVCKLLGNDNFENAILRDAVGNSSLSLEQSQFALNTPDYLLADGLDECGDNRAVISEKLRGWATGHSTTRIIVTTRIDSEPEYFPGWQLLKLLPLKDSDIIKFAKRLLGDLFNETKFKSWLQTSEITSLAAKNPLLLGFLIQIFQQDGEPIQNRAKLYGEIIDLAYRQPLQDRDPISLEEPTAKRIFAIVGWKLIDSPQCSESELWQYVGKELETELGISSLQAKKQAKMGVIFWENRGILERIKIGCDDVMIFIHLTIGEYAAGYYIYEINPVNIGKCLTVANQNYMWTWKESIFFATELGSLESIVTYLLQLDSLDTANSDTVLLAAKILQKSIDSPSQLIEQVIEQLKHKLELPNRWIVFETAEILLSLLPYAPELISSAATSYLEHHQSFTQLAAITLALASNNEENINTNDLEKQIDEIIAEVDANKKEFPALTPETMIVDLLLRNKLHSLQKNFLIYSFTLLLKKKPSSENIQRLKLITEEKFLCIKYQRMLIDFVSQELIGSKDVTSNDYLSVVKVLVCLYTSLKEYYSPAKVNQLASSLLKSTQNNRFLGQLILETIVLNSDDTLASSQIVNSRDFLLLGILFSGMGCWKFPVSELDMIEENHRSDAVSAAIKGASIAMDIDPQELAIEAKLLLEQIRQNEHLDGVKEERCNTVILQCIPQVPVIPQWDLTKNIDFSNQLLTDALDHPSKIIKCNAANILAQKIGEDQVMEIFREKGLIS
jgi:NACHT domain